MRLSREVDFYKTRRNAKAVLKNYRRLERIAGRSAVDVRSPIVTDMPKCDRHGNSVEDALLERVDAEGERDAILAAILSLGMESRHVLYYSFCTKERYTNSDIANKMDYSIRSIEEFKATALIEFAEAYKQGNELAYL